MISPVTVILGLCALFVAWSLWRMFGGKVPPAQARELVSGGALLVDVRTRDEFACGHLPKAVNVPVSELGHRAREIGHKERPVVVYCQSGMRSSTAARVLRRHGFRDVHDLGAMARWRAGS